MEGIGSYVSVVGLGSLFAGDLIIILMALILDAAKIMSVSFLYQYWDDIKSTMRYYMLSAVIVLMTITSAGAFGYLSGAFQKAVAPNMEVMLKVDSLKKEQDLITNEKNQLLDRKVKIDQQISQLPPENVKGRRQLIYSFKPEQEQISKRLVELTTRSDELTTEIFKAESENIDNQVHVGPIIYIAKIFDSTIEDTSKWIILVIIFVFDPLAVTLIVAGNFLIKRRKEEKNVEAVKLHEELNTLHNDQTFIASEIKELESILEDIQKEDLIERRAFENRLKAVKNQSLSSTKTENYIDGLTTSEVMRSEADHVHDQLLSEHPEECYPLFEHGEAPEPYSEDNDFPLVDQDLQLFEEIQEPSMMIDVSMDASFSGSPQVGLIAEARSSLDDLQIRFPSALIREGVVSRSNVRRFYE